MVPSGDSPRCRHRGIQAVQNDPWCLSLRTRPASVAGTVVQWLWLFFGSPTSFIRAKDSRCLPRDDQDAKSLLLVLGSFGACSDPLGASDGGAKPCTSNSLLSHRLRLLGSHTVV